MSNGLNPEIGRTIVYRGSMGEVVVSSSYAEDNLVDMTKIIKLVLDEVVVKGGTVSYVD